MNLSKALLWALPLSLLSSLGSVAFARKADLTILPALDSSVTGCPEKLVAYETPRPYSPGGYATDGMIQLAEIATDISVAQADDLSVVWVGTLKPEYADCEATAGISTLDGEDFQGHSYLRVQLSDGKARAILDMTGMSDPNGFTSVIIFQGMREGNPRWAWGGTD
ncbi:hypothetical protein N836_04965 [Leptolyngbya sp. Heron Island J]|uniref:hypothetical protein n=1 Tax=Leptolyngbya sp. Heron Island J TaxID=1385935 RepID=UPI0003B9B877|nr:hypothetical protein [Leptolyngbya sp. Heron Island J]ESA36914.1 hypothetical protein N836_04965 [Leptolyngbya sp. Heron Island J]